MTESWRCIPRTPGYEASSFGRVRRASGGPGARPGRILRQAIDQRGYPRVSPYVNGKGKQVPVSRLVAAAFHGPCPPGMQCNHISGDKADNRPENLEWVTPSENVQHAFRLGLRVSPRAGSPGEKNPRAKLTEEQAREFIRRHRGGDTAYSLSKRFGLHYSTAKNIAKGKLWKHLHAEVG